MGCTYTHKTCPLYAHITYVWAQYGQCAGDSWCICSFLSAHYMLILHIYGHNMGSARVIHGAYVRFQVPIICPYCAHTVHIYVPIYVPTHTCPYRCPYYGHDVGTSAHIVPIYEICAHEKWQPPYMGTIVPIYVPIQCP